MEIISLIDVTGIGYPLDNNIKFYNSINEFNIMTCSFSILTINILKRMGFVFNAIFCKKINIFCFYINDNQNFFIVSGNNVKIKNENKLNTLFQKTLLENNGEIEVVQEIYKKNNKLSEFFEDSDLNYDISKIELADLRINPLILNLMLLTYFKTFAETILKDTVNKSYNLIVKNKEGVLKKIFISRPIFNIFSEAQLDTELSDEFHEKLIKLIYNNDYVENFEKYFNEFFNIMKEKYKINDEQINRISFFLEYVKKVDISRIENIYNFFEKPLILDDIRIILTNSTKEEEIQKKMKNLKIGELKDIITILNWNIEKNVSSNYAFIMQINDILPKIIKNNDPFVSILKIEIFESLFNFITNILNNQKNYFNIKDSLKKLVELCKEFHKSLKDYYSTDKNKKFNEAFKKQFGQIEFFNQYLNTLESTVDELL
jgi:hypothetical protein